MKLAKLFKIITFGGALACFSSAGFAATTWTLDCPGSNPCPGNPDTATSTSGGITATVTAYGVGDGANDVYFNTVLTSWTGGLGAGPGSQPDHAIDNTDDYNGVNNVQEFAFIDFGVDGSGNDNLVELQQINLGYIAQDADVSVLAYTGADPFDVNTKLAGLKDSELVGAGWTIISNFDYLDGQVGTNQTIHNTTNETSRHWLVGAYNAAFSSGGCDVAYCVEGDDHFKLQLIKGTHVPPPLPPSSGVPIPGTAALLALGLMLMRSRKTK